MVDLAAKDMDQTLDAALSIRDPWSLMRIRDAALVQAAHVRSLITPSPKPNNPTATQSREHIAALSRVAVAAQAALLQRK